MAGESVRLLPDYLLVPPERLGEGTPVRVATVSGMHGLAEAMADAMFDAIREALASRGHATLIVPVGPVDPFPLLAERINREQLNCQDVVFINMDEYLTDDGQWIPLDHPLSFRAFIQRKFYDLIDDGLAPPLEHRIFPDPENVEAIEACIAERDGVDVCFGGIGINGHIAFNEPPEPGENIPLETFAQLPTRCLDLSRETRTINSVTVGGDISVIPRRAVTVGMREILAARRIHLFCNRPWQSAVVRRLLHGPIDPACPASLIRQHPDARLTMADYVAEMPRIELR